ncbi:MAG: 16S rRNA (guanine(966)-N(2))-methyltransferase RsmD [Povalibacter sp.]
MNARTPKNKSSTRAPVLANRLRIIGGRWRGVPIKFPPIASIRPSPDRVRETLFNWLQQVVVDARCLDLFAGSGALGIEALSRGASHVTFVDAEPQITQHLRQTLEHLRASSFDVFATDAIKFLKGPPQPFDLVFIDPPYASNLLQQACEHIASGWLAKKAWIYLECPADQALPALPPSWSLYRSKRAGQVGYHLVQAIS